MVKLELSEEDLDVIGKALGNAPYVVAQPIIAKLQKQYDAQRKDKKAA